MVKVRRLVKDDGAEPAAALAAAMMGDEGLIPRLIAEIEADLRAGVAAVYLAEDEGAACGVVQLKEVWTVEGGHLEVFRLYVSPAYRHRGIARKLLQSALEGLPPGLECPVVLTTSGPLPHSYARMGFEEISHVSVAPLSVIRDRMVDNVTRT